MNKKKYYCPRCSNRNIVEYEDSFECPLCILEFDKEEFDRTKDKTRILALQEKQGISEIFKDMEKKGIK